MLRLSGELVASRAEEGVAQEQLRAVEARFHAVDDERASLAAQLVQLQVRLPRTCQ